MNAIEAYLLARAYTNKAIEGSGALKGAPCQIKSITSITGGHRVTFEWEDSEGETSTETMDVMDGTNGTNGTDGDDGVGISSITYKEEDQDGNYVYTVLMTDSSGYDITCPKGPQGQTGQTGQTGATGNGIASIEKTSTSGLVDTYTITYTNGDTDTFTVTNGTTYTAGDYIDITSGEISVDREIPSVIAEYEIKTEPMVSGQAFISVTKTVNGEVVLTQKYGSSTAGIRQGINFDDNIYVDYSKTADWSWTYKLRNASVDHAANYTQSWHYTSTVDYTEEFYVTDHRGDKLVIKSELDTALETKQDTLTFDDTPTDGSNNPVKSNGIYDSEKDIYAAMGEMGAKNLISYPYHQNTKTEYGVTFTNNGDGSVTVSTVNTGATAEATFICHNRLNTEANELRIKNGKYILSGCPQGGSATTYLLTTNRTYNGSSEAMGNEYGSGKVITLNGDDYGADGVNLGISIVVKSGTIITTPITFKPMLRLASDTDDTYQPYAKTNKQLTDDVALLDSGKADTDMVAADFNAGTSYTAGNYCIYDGKFYKFKNNHSGAWSAADVDEVKITGELSSLKSGLTNLGSVITPTVGTNITLLNGGYTVIGNMVCVNISISTAEVIPLNTLIATIVPPAVNDTPISIYNINTFNIVLKGRLYTNGNIVASESLDASAVYIIVGCYIKAS